MTTLGIIVAVGLGAIIGSFLNMLLFRFHTGYSVLGRSRCIVCSHTLSWRDLVPLLSFVIQRGRCRYCRTNIPAHYFVIELITAAVFLVAYLQFGFSVEVFLAAAIGAVLVLIAAYDVLHTIIPNAFSLTFIALSLLSWFVRGNDLVIPLVGWSDFIAPVLFAGLFALLWIISRGRWMGLGDAKLVFGTGILLGLIPGLSAIILAFWIGALFSVVTILTQRVWGQSALNRGGKELTMKSAIPFAPYLVLGTLLVFFFHVNVLSF